MGKGLFITGTDTGVGKTLVACGLASALRERGLKIGVMKPAETGCQDKGGDLFPQDAFYLKEASGTEEPIHRICPYRLASPLAPSVAAEESGIEIQLSLLIQLYTEVSRANDLTLVEGAGGLLVPLHSRSTYADLVLRLKLPVIVVVGNRLGAINHTLLTLEHASKVGIEVAGYVLNDLESQPSPATKTNGRSLQALTSVPCLGTIPHLEASQFRGNGMDLRPSFLSSLFQERINFGLLALHLEKDSPSENKH
ncbi:MAG: dethiobiotin synthase [Deltaproteobacteria bacterium]|nr:dethiobiotin synthase [Deltaproteobacteria bacterium]